VKAHGYARVSLHARGAFTRQLTPFEDTPEHQQLLRDDQHADRRFDALGVCRGILRIAVCLFKELANERHRIHQGVNRSEPVYRTDANKLAFNPERAEPLRIWICRIPSHWTAYFN